MANDAQKIFWNVVSFKLLVYDLIDLWYLEKVWT